MGTTTRRLGRKAAPALATLALLPVALFAQPPAASPTQPETLDSRTTIKARVRQVLLDVAVSDWKNRPVAGLQQRDFSVFEDGKPQKIVSFEIHSASTASDFKPPVLPVLPPNTFVNASTSRDDLPLNVLLYDLLNTPFDDQPFAQREILKFLRTKPPGSRFAIFVLTDKLRLLQGFTDDERLLASAMNGKAAGSYSSTTYQSLGSEHGTSAQLSESGLLPNNPGGQSLLDHMQHMESVAATYFLNDRIERTIKAFAEIGKFVSGLPGRKNLIWLSGSFPAGIFPGGDPTDPFAGAVSYRTELRQAADLLTLGQIAVYPVDIRGLTVNSVYSASSSRIYRSSAAFAAAHGRFGQGLSAEHATMDKIAEDTGGHAFYNTNGLTKAIATSADNGANYYTLSYSPTNTKFDGGLRRIRVVLSHKDYQLAYRRSYLADEEAVFAEKTAQAGSDQMNAEMRRGAPAAHALTFGAHVMPQGEPAPITQAQISQLSQFPAFASQKKWDAMKMQRYSIDYAVLGRQLTFAPSPSGAQNGKFEFFAAAYDADDTTMNGQRSQVDQSLSPTDLAAVRKESYRARLWLDVPSGAKWLRLAVRDVLGDRVGSMEISLPLPPEPVAPEAPPQSTPR